MTGIEKASSINRSIKNDRMVGQIADAIELAEDRKKFRGEDFNGSSFFSSISACFLSC